MKNRNENHCEKQVNRRIIRERSWENRHNRVKNLVITIILLSFLLMFIAPFFVSCSPVGVAVWNTYDYAMRKTDDATNYKTIKKVEDSCRAMIASYEADKLTWEQYKDSDNEEKQSWAEQAKMRANKTASTYNNYILENSFVWENNVPDDIKSELEYLQ